MSTAPPSSPDWDRLFELAASQAGHFTTQQAAGVGYSAQLLAHHAVVGRLRRLRRGVYRLVHFPLTEHEDLPQQGEQSFWPPTCRGQNRGQKPWPE